MSKSSVIELSDSNRPSQRNRFREPAVLVTIVCLTIVRGITTAVEDEQLKRLNVPRILSLWKLCHSILPVPAIILVFFLANYTGRKPVLIFFYLLAALTSILHSISLQGTWLLLAFIVQGIFKGGTLAITFLSIWEYSSKKHSLKYIAGNIVAWQMTEDFTRRVLYRGNVLGNDSVYMQAVPVVLWLACLGWIWTWPESPHWLASKGRTNESRSASKWLRGEESEDELELLQRVIQAPRDPGPPPLFSLSLLIMILALSLHQISVWHKSNTAYYTSPESVSEEFKTALLLCSGIGIACLVALIVNKVKQKVVFFIIGGVAVYYVSRYLAEQLAVKPNQSIVKAFIISCDLIDKYAPLLLGLTYLTMAVPQKYSSHVYTFVAYIYLGISAIVLIKVGTILNYG